MGLRNYWYVEINGEVLPQPYADPTLAYKAGKQKAIEMYGSSVGYTVVCSDTLQDRQNTIDRNKRIEDEEEERYQRHLNTDTGPGIIEWLEEAAEGSPFWTFVFHLYLIGFLSVVGFVGWFIYELFMRVNHLK